MPNGENEFKEEDLIFEDEIYTTEKWRMMSIEHIPSEQIVSVIYNDNGQSKHKIKANLMNVLKHMRID